MHTLLPILFILLIVNSIVGLVLRNVFLAQLRSRHRQTWDALGRPTLLNNSIANGLKVQRFLWRQEYRILGDGPFARFGSFLRFYMVAYLLLFGLTIVVFIINGIWKHG